MSLRQHLVVGKRFQCCFMLEVGKLPYQARGTLFKGWILIIAVYFSIIIVWVVFFFFGDAISIAYSIERSIELHATDVFTCMIMMNGILSTSWSGLMGFRVGRSC